jgi:hypothetical protein
MIPAGTNVCEILLVSTTGTWTTNFRIGAGVSGDATVSATFRQPQIDAGTTRTAYQRVTTAFDVTEAGQRDCYGVRTDGIDDRYATANAVNLSTTGQVTVWCALRSRTSTPIGAIFNTPNAATNDALLADNRFDNSYGADIRLDDSNRILAHTGTITKPAYSIVRGRYNLAASGSARMRLFVNGTENVIFANFGTMTRTAFLNEVIHLFARSNGTQPANIDFYGGIIAGGGYSLAIEERVDRLLSRITPTVNL